MPDIGIEVTESGDIRCGDLANPKVTVTRAQIESWVANRTIEQVQTRVDNALNPHGYYCKVLSLAPLAYALSDTPFT